MDYLEDNKYYHKYVEMLDSLPKEPQEDAVDIKQLLMLEREEESAWKKWEAERSKTKSTEKQKIKESSGSHSRNEASSLGVHSNGLVHGISSLTPRACSSRGGADDGSAVATTSPGGPTTKQTKTRKRRRRVQKKQAFVKSQKVEQIEEEPKLPMESSDSDSGTVDPGEPRYCICDDVAFGKMVACDNKKCPNKWFHYGCVGITSAPKGEWYCPICGGPAEA